MKLIDVLEAKVIYKKGGNVTQYLRTSLNSKHNTSEIIEIAYDLQAGSYVDYVKKNYLEAQNYAAELSGILSQYLAPGDSMLDVGTGEMTTLTLVLNKLNIELSHIIALDISWSRLSVGRQFHEENKNIEIPLTPIVADIKELPLHDKCIDVVTSSHALEPNGKNLKVLLLELFRVAKKRLVLFEPSYELNSKKGKVRMDQLGYIKDIEGTVTHLGGTVIDVVPIKSSSNPLNPTACYIIEPPTTHSVHLEEVTWSVPGTNSTLRSNGQYMFSSDTGLIFPIIDEIPVLKNKSAILATSKC